MRAITIRQPWASLVALGVKTIETRSWRTSYRGPLAIHAGVRMPKARAALNPCRDDVGDWHVTLFDSGYMLTSHTNYGEWHSMPPGAVVATCTLLDVVPMVDEIPPQSEWREPWARVTVEPWPILCTWPGFGSADGRSISDQLPYGDFAPGRYAWLLDDVQPIDPVPAKGKLGLWEWEQ